MCANCAASSINGRPETALKGASEVTEKARNAYAAYFRRCSRRPANGPDGEPGQ